MAEPTSAATRNPPPPPSNPTGVSSPLPATEAASSPPSRFYRAIMGLFSLAVIGAFLTLILLTFMAVDFLDLYQVRYLIPNEWRQKWPLAPYYDFVRLHQLPDEDRFQELIQRKIKQYDELIARGSTDLKQRTDGLEGSYRELVKAQEETFRQRQSELEELKNQILRQKDDLARQKQELEGRQQAVDTLSQQLASEATNLEGSLIRFMEGENRLRPVQDIAATMDPRALATILDEVTDNQMIFDIFKGVPPEQSALVLSYMDPEKAGKILKMSKALPVLPAANARRSYIPPGLESLIASTGANLR